MSGVAAAAPMRRPGANLVLRTALRNVGRNRRRTWLTAGGIGFAVFLVTVSIALQDGSYVAQRGLATGLLTGHVQIAHADYPDESKLEQLVPAAAEELERLRALPGVLDVSARVQSFALVSVGERSFAAQVMGVDVDREARRLAFFGTLIEGAPPVGPDQAVIGAALARNLGAELNDELVLLGSGRGGGVAALALTVSGIFQTGISDVDRSLLVAPLASVQDAFGLENAAHNLIVLGDGPLHAQALAATLNEALEAPAEARPWQRILPEVEQAIELDRVSGDFMYGIIMLLVGFSVVNTFVMVMFERTREFGMLLALGMPPWRIIGMVQLEALMVWVLGLLIGALLAVPLIGYLATAGLSLGETIEQMAEQMYMPSRIYAAPTLRALLTAPLILLVATQLAALLPSLRLRRLRPVEALRQEG